jgi:hypothetical protein
VPFRGLDRPFLLKTLEIQTLQDTIFAFTGPDFGARFSAFSQQGFAPTLICRKIDYRNGKRTNVGNPLIRPP